MFIDSMMIAVFSSGAASRFNITAEFGKPLLGVFSAGGLIAAALGSDAV